MLTTDTSALPRAQVDAENIQAGFPPQAIELQALKLRQRFALAPATARTLANIAFAAEA
ncbi:hypothetical protein IVB02_29690 [Bradyrhizobium sp. 166]|uniref:hypothetical protein n=1 Tax=Bradyrhizobium sp. 166 TaxID=2782638 RepID=UPI001FF73B0C|nr:hypothetical protein [Bradyrhizobium sp. 166]MCK1605459.1 hypothetical protein [Bradyrhizobium sp. 166]